MIFSAHLSMLFRELPYLERPAAAAAAGFTVVETWWPGPTSWRRGPSRSIVTRSACSSLNCDGGEIEAGERGFLNVPERHDESLAAFRAAAAAAGRCGAPYVNVLVGRDTGRVPGRSSSRVAASALAACAESARGCDVRIVIEPINDRDVPGYLVPTPRGGARARSSSPGQTSCSCSTTRTTRRAWAPTRARRRGVAAVRRPRALRRLPGPRRSGYR